ncbi:MAG: hypothetical protein MI919_27950, partial [Holophagales bacterium]|nr:hypothetical protein [Holophagales bacterium]
MSTNLGLDRSLAELFRATHGGPVFGESLSMSHLLGEWVSSGQFDIHNGRGRLVIPEYKLRRLNQLSAFHGVGQNYRFTDISQRWHANRYGWLDPAELDDYRATQIMFGNGAYLYLEHQLDAAPWAHYLTEVLIVGHLQHYFVLQSIDQIEYHLAGTYQGGTWKTLEQMVEEDGFVMITNNGREIEAPWEPKPQSPELERIRIRYSNGTVVVVNRGSSDFEIVAGSSGLVTLPPSGWALWNQTGGNDLLAYSARPEGFPGRIDFMADNSIGVRVVDPRGGVFAGADRLTQWIAKDGTWRVRLEADLDGASPSVLVDGARIPLAPTQRPPLTTFGADFRNGLEGWRPIGGVLTVEETQEGIRLSCRSEDNKLYSPPVATVGSANDQLLGEMRLEEPVVAGGEV